MIPPRTSLLKIIMLDIIATNPWFCRWEGVRRGCLPLLNFKSKGHFQCKYTKDDQFYDQLFNGICFCTHVKKFNN